MLRESNWTETQKWGAWKVDPTERKRWGETLIISSRCTQNLVKTWKINWREREVSRWSLNSNQKFEQTVRLSFTRNLNIPNDPKRLDSGWKTTNTNNFTEIWIRMVESELTPWEQTQQGWK